MRGRAVAESRRCAVVGHPVGHSLSPVMHGAAYRALGLDWDYDAVDVDPGALASFVTGLDGTWRGLSVTAPHKRDALALADEASDVARSVGAANTLVIEAGRVRADNTDVPGLVAALREAGVETLDLVRVLGAGATAASTAHAVAALGARRLDLVVRDPDRAEETAASARSAGLEVRVRRSDAPLVDPSDLLVSTVPADAIGSFSHDLVDSTKALFDVVYEPWPTPLATAAVEAGMPCLSGIDLLAHQAALQVRLMTGSDVDVDVLRDAALQALA